MLERVARSLAAVIAVSEFTRDELVELLGVREERVHVVPNGVGPPFTPAGAAASGEYVLAVATLEPRKNLDRLVQAFERANLGGCELRVVGASGWGDVTVGGPSIRWLGEVPDEELAALYRGALCVAYVSLYEGFGLPVLEAMACGAPVVASTAPALRELGGDAVVAVDPLDPDAIADGLEEAIARRDDLRMRGLERAGSFTWQRTAEQTAAVYRAVAEADVSRPLVVVDADVLGRHRTGDETYVAALLGELSRLAEDLRIAAVTRSRELVPAGVEPFVLPARSQVMRLAIGLPRLLRRLRPALVHELYALPVACPCPAVVTVPDLSFELAPGLMRRRDVLIFRRVVRTAVVRAARVLTHSDRTRRDLMSVYGLPETKIVVVPHGVDPIFTPAPHRRGGYALTVGVVTQRKNPLVAAEAARAAGLPLVVAGPVRDTVLAAELARGGAKVTGYVTQRRAGESLSRRRMPALPVPLRGLRPSGRGGDGLRHSRRLRRRAGTTRGRRRRGAVRDRRVVRRGRPGGARRPGAVRRGRARAGAAVLLGDGGAANARRLPGSHRRA